MNFSLIFEVVAVGIFACIIFDLWQRIFQSLTSIPPSNWSMVGRWFFNLLNRQVLFVSDLNNVPKFKNETIAGWSLYYAIAIGYSSVYIILNKFNFLVVGLIDGMIFGIISVVVPWFFFLPALGNGVLARLTPKPILVCSLALMMHTIFGVSIGTGYLVFDLIG